MIELEKLNEPIDSAVQVSADVWKQLASDNRTIFYDGVLTAQAALRIKEEKRRRYCLLPLDHTLEAELLGADIIHDMEQGSRTGETLPTETPVLPIQEMIRHPRLAAVLEAADKLAHAGQPVIFNLTGPLTIIELLYGFDAVMEYLRRPEQYEELLQNIQAILLYLTRELSQKDVSVLAYGDPTGDISLLGKCWFTKRSGPLNRRIIEVMQQEYSGVFHMHPMLAESFIQTKQMSVCETHLIQQSLGDDLLAQNIFQKKIVSRLSQTQIKIVDFVVKE